MKKLYILLTILLFLTPVGANSYAQTAGERGAGGCGPGANASNLVSSGALSPGSSDKGSPSLFGTEPRGQEPFYSPGADTGKDNDKPGLDMGK